MKKIENQKETPIEPTADNFKSVNIHTPEHLSFPGVFKNTALLPPAPRLEKFENVTASDVYETFKVYGPAINFGHTCGAPEFLNYINARKLKLANNDPSGLSIKQLEAELINLYKMIIDAEPDQNKKILRLPIAFNRALGSRLIESPHGIMVNLESDITKLELQKSTSDLTQTVNTTELANSTKDLIRQNYALGFLRTFTGRALNSFISEELEKLNSQFKTLTKELELPEDQAQIAKFELLRQSKRDRILSVLDKARELDKACSNATDSFLEISKIYPVFGPMVVLTLAEGKLYGEEREADVTALADSKSLAKSTLLTITKRGLGFSMMHYDNQWGRINGHTTCYSDLVHELNWLTPEKIYSMNYHAAIVNMFPTLALTDFSKAIEQLSSVDFNEYLNDRNNWFGPVMKRNKPWLAPESDDLEKRLDVMRDVTEYLNGSKTGEGDSILAENMTAISSIFDRSIFMNYQADRFLFYIASESVRTGIALKDLKLGMYGSTTALEYAKALWKHEGIITLGFMFKEVDGSQLALTDFAVRYIIELVDPENPYYEAGDDNTLLRELNEHKRNNFLRFNPAEILKKMSDFESQSHSKH